MRADSTINLPFRNRWSGMPSRIRSALALVLRKRRANVDAVCVFPHTVSLSIFDMQQGKDKLLWATSNVVSEKVSIYFQLSHWNLAANMVILLRSHVPDLITDASSTSVYAEITLSPWGGYLRPIIHQRVATKQVPWLLTESRVKNLRG